MSTVDNVADTEENVELPDDFFDEFEDSKFLDKIVEIVVPEQTRLVRPDNVNDNSTETNKSSNDQPNEEEPLYKRCLNEIDNLTKSIERRKRKLRGEITTTDNGKRKNRRSHSPPSSRLDRNVRSRDRRLSPARRSPSGPRSRRVRSRSRERNRSRDRPDRRLSRSRRDRSRSDSPANQPRHMSFLEELERKFAENGQDFPEKDLLIQMRAKQNGTTGMNPYPATVGYSQVPISPYIQLPSMHIPMPMYNRPYQPQWNGNYMMDPMASMQHPMQPILLPSPCVNGTTPNVIQNATTAIPTKPSNKAEVVARCRAASKVLRGEENKVPKLRFLFTRTSMPIEANEEQTPPLQSRKNVEFEQTSDNQKPFAPLQFLPVRTRELVKVLGYDCSAILSRLRLKEFADKVIEDIDAEKKRSKERAYKDGEMQTESYKCPTCINRESKVFSSKSMQTDAPKKVSIRTQTNEKDYRDPLIRSLSRLTAGQLVAVSDFVDLLINEPRPSTSTEVFSVREKLMDIYNLSERGSDAIEAERAREHESRRRGINNSSMASPPLEDLRATIRGTSDHNMGRVPPPPPLLMNYHMDVAMLDSEHEERENRLQQLRFEESRRLHFDEQRRREWEIQQHIQQQQQRLQLQREQEEENARLEMRNDRFGRGNHWNGARGHGRY